jgi:hypothetical protein
MSKQCCLASEGRFIGKMDALGKFHLVVNPSTLPLAVRNIVALYRKIHNPRQTEKSCTSPSLEHKEPIEV